MSNPNRVDVAAHKAMTARPNMPSATPFVAPATETARKAAAEQKAAVAAFQGQIKKLPTPSAEKKGRKVAPANLAPAKVAPAKVAPAKVAPPPTPGKVGPICPEKSEAERARLETVYTTLFLTAEDRDVRFVQAGGKPLAPLPVRAGGILGPTALGVGVLHKLGDRFMIAGGDRPVPFAQDRRGYSTNPL